MTIHPTVLLVGESPPPNAPPDFRPFDCDSGSRLAKILGMTSRACLLDHVPRDNIFHDPGVGVVDGRPWSRVDASRCAEDLLARHYRDKTVFVILGRRPAAAFGLIGTPAWGTWERCNARALDFLVAPHPSGRASVLSSPVARADFRRYLLPELVAGCPTLRPWHFDLDESEILFDLGAAVSPLDVPRGVAALRVSQEVHRAQSVPRGQLVSGLTVESYRATVDVPMRAIAEACAADYWAVADVLSRVGPERINVARVGTELRSRAKAAASDPRVKEYPPAVLRATIGRYVALGVL